MLGVLELASIMGKKNKRAYKGCNGRKESMRRSRGEIVDLKGNVLIPASRKAHKCTVCGRVDVWDNNWDWYGSYKDIDDGNEVIKTCSNDCRRRLQKK